MATKRDSKTGAYTVTRDSKTNSTTVREAVTGKTLPVKGYGVMKGKLPIKEGVDLTKPIYSQIKETPSRKKVITEASSRKHK